MHYSGKNPDKDVMGGAPRLAGNRARFVGGRRGDGGKKEKSVKVLKPIAKILIKLL